MTTDLEMAYTINGGQRSGTAAYDDRGDAVRKDLQQCPDEGFSILRIVVTTAASTSRRCDVHKSSNPCVE